MGIVNPSARDKLLAAIHELKLFGGPLPDNKHFSGNNNTHHKRRLLPVLSNGAPRLQNKHEPGKASRNLDMWIYADKHTNN